MSVSAVLDFWFRELGPEKWFASDTNLDAICEDRFGELHKQAAAAELYSWRKTHEGRLAEILLLDQFSRNIHRNTPGAFASDAMALALAQEAVALGVDMALSQDERKFIYMPYMHSESAKIHEEAMRLFSGPGMEDNLDFEKQHKAIVDRFGRYPHRNEILGRESTEAEKAFLATEGSSF